MLRLSWSPDGHYLVSAHAMNNSGPTAQIIEREGWKTNMDFVGHRKAVTVVVSVLSRGWLAAGPARLVPSEPGRCQGWVMCGGEVVGSEIQHMSPICFILNTSVLMFKNRIYKREYILVFSGRT